MATRMKNVLTTTGTRHELWKDGVKVAEGPNADLKYVGLAPGSYVVKAFADGNQDEECSGETDPILIEQPDEVTVTAEGTDVSCYGEADGYIQVLTTTGTRHELWKDGVKVAEGPNADLKYVGLAPGSYVVKAFADGNQDEECSGETDPILIEQPDEVTVTAEGTDVSCYGEADGYIQVLTTTGTRHELWKDGVKVAEGPNADLKYVGLAPGSYVVKAFADGNQDEECSGETDPILIEQPDEVTVTAEGTDVSCYGEADGYIQVLTTTGTRHELWKDGVKVAEGPNADLKYVGLAPGSYVVKAFADGNQDEECSGETDPILIEQPDEVTVTAEGTDVSCYGEADGYIRVLTTTGTRHELWKDGVKVAEGPNADLKYVGLAPGSYVVKAFADGNQDAECSGETDLILIEQPDELTCEIIEFTESECEADNGTATVAAYGGTPPYNYLWNDPMAQTTATAVDLAPGLYIVTITDTNGCETTCEVEITEEPCIINCETAYAMLEGDGVCFINNGFDRWGWTNPVLVDGEYTLPVYAGAAKCDPLNGWGQVGEVTISKSGNLLVVKYVMEQGFSMNEVHIYVGAGKYPLDKKGKETVAPGQYTYNMSGLDRAIEYTVTFNNVTGPVWVIAHAVVCDIKGTAKIEDSITLKSASIASMNASELKAYPNPFNSKVTFEFVSAKDARARLEITNMVGQRVTVLMDQMIRQGVMNRIEYTPVDVVSGILIYRLILDDHITTGRLIYKVD
jgi:uncharacterized protein (DUF2141 family)